MGPPADRLAPFEGRYRFAPGMTATVTLGEGVLLLEGPDRESIYLPRGGPVAANAASGGAFVLDTERADEWTRADYR